MVGLQILILLNPLGPIKEIRWVLGTEVNSPDIWIIITLSQGKEANVAFHQLGQLFWKAGKLSEIGKS